jgi:hypothetical protein
MLDSLWNWLTSIHPAIWGSLITGSMTLSGVVAGQLIIKRREESKKEEETQALQDALIVELRSYDEWLEWLLYTAHDLDKVREDTYGISDEQFNEAFRTEMNARIAMFRHAADVRPTAREIYESNTDRIGELEPRTAEMVVRTYMMLEKLDKHLQNLQNSVSHDMLTLNSDIDWSTGEGLPPEVIIEKTMIEDTVARAVVFQKPTLAVLGDKVSKSDREAFAFAYSNMEAKSEEEANFQRFLDQYMEKYDFSSFEDLVNSKTEHPMGSSS